MKPLLCLLSLALCGCQSPRTGGETNVLAGHLRAASGTVGKSRADAKEIVRLVHSASDLQKRIDGKTARALRLLDR